MCRHEFETDKVTAQVIDAGKNVQVVPVGVGKPSLRMDKITIGGAA